MLKRALNELFALSSDSKEFEECVNTVSAENRSHLTYEQNQAWPRLDDVLSPVEQEQTAQWFARVRAVAPTRPHPHVPASPGLLRAVGPVLSGRDRTVDRLRGLGDAHATPRVMADGSVQRVRGHHDGE